jgi:hypothetical protein
MNMMITDYREQRKEGPSGRRTDEQILGRRCHQKNGGSIKRKKR